MFKIVETTESLYNFDSEKRESTSVWQTPCLRTFRKEIIEYGKMVKGKWRKYRQPKTTPQTEQDIINKHCVKCRPCKIASGKSKASVLTQDEIARLFALGIDGKHSSTGNMRSQDGILTHYRTTEAIRTIDGTVIKNRECWSRGFAICPSVPNVKHRLDLSTLYGFVRSDNELRSLEVLDSDDNGNYLIRIKERYFLDGQDERQRYISELVEPCKTLKEAYESMKPKTVKVAEMHGLDVKRQGELFFIPISTALTKPKIINIQKRTSEKCVYVYFECVKCGIRHKPNYYEEDNDTVRHPHFFWSAPPNVTKEQKNCSNLRDWETKEKRMERRLRLGVKYSPYPNIIVKDGINKPLETRHTATRTGQLRFDTVVKGVIRHETREHRALNLGDKWHLVLQNRVITSVNVGTGVSD